MSKRKARQPQPGTSSVQSAREVLTAQVVEPRSVSSLDPKRRQMLRELQTVRLEIRALEERQDQIVRRLRTGLVTVGWSAIGWAVGTTGEASRQRWGSR